ncbi:MAG: SGNH/GDSL hydrolase family protein, partial [Pseudomonadota bacterium]
LGIRDIDHTERKSDNEFRIIGMGDSWTEGQGAPFEQTYLKTLERSLNDRSGDVVFKVISGGVAGSDPFYGYRLLADKLLPLGPDLVTVTVNESDIGDVIVRGGKERFVPDGSLQYAEPPGDEWLFARSHLYRFITKELFGYDWFLLSKSDKRRKRAEAIDQLAVALQDFQALANQSGFDFVAILHPALSEFKRQQYQHDFDRLKARLDSEGIRYFDLMEYFDEEGYLESQDPTAIYWQYDYHHNADGYALFAEGLESYLRGEGLIPERSTDL